MENNIDFFLQLLDPENKQTGGGTASAIAGAMAAGLVGMVARLSHGRKVMPEPDLFYQRANDEAVALSQGLFDGGRADAQAFDDVMNAYRLPKKNDAQMAHRQEAIQKALIGATRTPLANAEMIVETLDLCLRLQGRSNPNAASDLECAYYLAQAGLKGCLSNVAINIASLKRSSATKELERQFQRLSSQLETYPDRFSQ